MTSTHTLIVYGEAEQENTLTIPFFDLPKWPATMISGKQVTREQAKEIIMKCDSWLIKPTKWGSNYKEGIYRQLAKIGHDGEETIETYRTTRAIADKMGALSLNYLSLDWAFSSYIYGPSGWVDAAGKIFMWKNIGKWPSVNEVAEDLMQIAQAFPFLDMVVTLFDKEFCEEDGQPIVSFHVKEGALYQVLNDIAKQMHDENEMQRKLQETQFDRSTEKFIASLNDRSCEQGLNEEFFDEWAMLYNAAKAEVTKDIVENQPTSKQLPP